MRPIRTITAPLAAVLATATLATPAIARPIDFAAHLSEPATRSSQNLSSPDVQHAPCTLDLAGTTSRPRQDLRSPDTRNAAAHRGTVSAPNATISGAGDARASGPGSTPERGDFISPSPRAVRR
jgi:hypothetical protein